MYLLTFKIAVVLCMFNIHAECFNVNHGVRIIDGEDADIKDFPHYAQVQMRCGGAILSDRWVATVASCNKLPSETLKKMDVHRLTTEECLDLIPSDERDLIERNIEDLEKSFFCGKREGDKPGFCFGDVGGPLTEGDTLVGLAAFLQSPCCGEHRLGFYLNVANFVPWIKSITGLD